MSKYSHKMVEICDGLKTETGNSFEAGFGMQSMTVENQSVVVVLYI